MSQTALIIKNDSREKIYSLNLNMYLNTDVIVKPTIPDFIKLVEVLPKLDLVIMEESDYSLEEVNNLLTEMKNRIPHTPLIMMSTRTTPLGEETLVHLEGDVKPLLKASAKLLGITAIDMANLKTPDYIPFSLAFFEIIDFTPCALYTFIDKRYEPFKDAKQKLTSSDFTQLKAKKLTHIHILARDRLKFTNFFTQNMDKKLKEVKPDTEKIADTSIAVQVTQQYIQELGLDETALKMTKSCMDSMYKIVKSVGTKGNTLDKMLSQLLNNQSSYNFTHSQLTAVLACHAIGQMSWGSEEQQEKIVFISFFHNVLLKNDDYCKIQTEDEVKALNIPQKEKDEILKHAQNTAQLLSQYPKVPIGSDDIVKQHHGSRNGIGFPEQAAAAISPLAMVFYVAELLAHALLVKPFDQKAAFEKINAKAPKGTKTKSIIEALEKLNFSQFV